MSLPNFNQIKEINSLLEKIQELQAKLDAQVLELSKEKEKIEKIKKQFKQTFVANLKQTALLESIQKEINELKSKEQELKDLFNQSVDQALETFFTNGGFTRYVNSLYQTLKSKGSVTVFAGANARQYFPVDTPEDFPESANGLRMKTPNKTYILDIDKVKVTIKEKVFQSAFESN
jgi:small-conductance mechanosensitive channel